MKRKKLVSGIMFTLATAFLLHAEVVFDSNTTPHPFYLRGETRPADIDIRWDISFNDGMGRVPGVFCVTSKPFAVDVDSTYRLSGEFRIIGAKGPLKNFHFAFQPRDKEGRAIFVHEVQMANPTLGVLAEDALDGDTQIFFRKNDWRVPYPHWLLAFEAQEDMSDIPNRKCTARLVKDSVVAVGDELRVTLTKPLVGSYPAGTKVRLHSDGPTYLYTGKGQQPTAEWTAWSGVIHGMVPLGRITPMQPRWYPGTIQANVIFRCFDVEMQGAVMEFRNIRVEREENK